MAASTIDEQLRREAAVWRTAAAYYALICQVNYLVKGQSTIEEVRKLPIAQQLVIRGCYQKLRALIVALQKYLAHNQMSIEDFCNPVCKELAEDLQRNPFWKAGEADPIRAMEFYTELCRLWIPKRARTKALSTRMEV